MATIYTRASKGSALTWTEGDANITNLNTDKIEAVVDDTSPQLGGNLDVNGNEITTTVVDGGLILRANGAGAIEAISDGFQIGTGTSDAILTSNGATNMVIDTNDGVNSGSITITAGLNGNITVTPNGTGKVDISGLLYPNADGTASQFIQTDGAGNLSFSTVTQATGNELENVVEDTTPQLGGNLDVNGNQIVSVSNGNIVIAPNGTGKTIVSNLKYNEGVYTIGTNQSGTITPDAANGNLQYIEIGGNITINGLNNPTVGDSVTIILDSLGTYTLTSTMLFAGGDKTLTDTGVDILSILYLGDSVYLASLNKDFS